MSIVRFRNLNLFIPPYQPSRPIKHHASLVNPSERQVPQGNTMREQLPSIYITANNGEERHLLSSDSVVNSLRYCATEPRHVNDNPIRKVEFWRDLEFLLSSGLATLEIRATASGRMVLDTFEKIGDDLSEDDGYKNHRIRQLEESLEGAREQLAGVCDLNEKAKDSTKEREAALDTRLKKMETDMAIVRREVGDERWREILEQGGGN